MKYSFLTNLCRPDPGRRKKIDLKVYFHFYCGVSKGFMKALNVLIKPFETTHRKKIKIQVNFYLNPVSGLQYTGQLIPTHNNKKSRFKFFHNILHYLRKC